MAWNLRVAARSVACSLGATCLVAPELAGPVHARGQEKVVDRLDVAGVVGVVVHGGDLGGAEPVTVTVGVVCLFCFFLKGGDYTTILYWNFVFSKE